MLFGVLLLGCVVFILVRVITLKSSTEDKPTLELSKKELLQKTSESTAKERIELLLEQKKENIQSSSENNPKTEIQTTYEDIIRLAYHSDNKLSVKDLIIKTSMTIEQATDCLENLAKKGFCEIKLEEIEKTGKIYYYFD